LEKLARTVQRPFIKAASSFRATVNKHEPKGILMFRAFGKHGAATIAAFAFTVATLAIGGASAAAGPDTSDGHGTHVTNTISEMGSSRNNAKVCCQLPRARTARLTTAKGCKARRGRAVAKARCAGKLAPRKYKRVSMAKFRRILKTAKPIGRSSGKPINTRLGEFALYDEYDPSREGVHCMGGKYYPCWCEGANTCNNFIAACVELNGSLNCNDHNKEGQPTGCSCYK
jgi:hypothetical protein